MDRVQELQSKLNSLGSLVTFRVTDMPRWRYDSVYIAGRIELNGRTLEATREFLDEEGPDGRARNPAYDLEPDGILDLVCTSIIQAIKDPESAITLKYAWTDSEGTHSFPKEVQSEGSGGTESSGKPCEGSPA